MPSASLEIRRMQKRAAAANYGSATDAELCRRIEKWLSDSIASIEKEESTPATTAQIDSLQEQYLQANEFRWPAMHRSRYTLPNPIQLVVVRFMRRYDIVSKSQKRNSEKYEELYCLLSVQSSASSTLQPDFAHLCRNKINSFIQTKGRALQQQQICSIVNREVQWKEYTSRWLEPGWNGDTTDPEKKICTKCMQPLREVGNRCKNGSPDNDQRNHSSPVSGSNSRDCFSLEELLAAEYLLPIHNESNSYNYSESKDSQSLNFGVHSDPTWTVSYYLPLLAYRG